MAFEKVVYGRKNKKFVSKYFFFKNSVQDLEVETKKFYDITVKTDLNVKFCGKDGYQYFILIEFSICNPYNV